MNNIPLSTIANQSLSIQLDGSRYDITIKETTGLMVISVARDSIQIVDSNRILVGQPLIPYRYLATGNLFIVSDSDDLPYWDKFNVTQFLVFATAAEVANASGT
jgi:hypothetical protein